MTQLVKFDRSNSITRYNQGNGDRLTANADESLLGHCIEERGWSLEKAIQNIKPLSKYEAIHTTRAARIGKVTAVAGFVVGLVGGGTVGAVGMLPLLGAGLAAYVWNTAQACIPRRDLEYSVLKICPQIPEIMLAVHRKGASPEVIVSAWDLLLDSYAESEGANAEQVVLEFARLLDHVGRVPELGTVGENPTTATQQALMANSTPALPVAGKTCGLCQNFAKNGDGFRLDIGNESQFDGGCKAFMQPANSQDPGSNCPQFAAKNAVSPPPVDTAGFDWQWLNTRYDDYPHILILGKTGAGKSYLAERLGRFLTGSTLVLTPKKKPGTFAGLEVVGVPYNFAAIANRLSAITQLVKDRESEMDRTGREDFEPLNVILDDTPSFIAGCKDEGYDVVKDLKFIIRNARTSKVRLIILVQGAEVKALGIEGEGSLRDCLSYIRLRGFAEPYAKSLGDVIARQVASMDRPATVEDMPADVMELCRVADGMSAPSVPASAIHYPPPAPDHQGRTEKPKPVTTMPAPDLEKSAATLEQQIADFIKAYPPGNGGLKLREIKRKFRNEEPKKVEGICLTLARCFPDKFRISEDTVGGNKTIKVEAIT
jgi:hypothetical protein